MAAEILKDPRDHRGATYNLTGPEALTLTDIAQTITQETGRLVTFHNESVAEAYESRRRWEAPQWQYDAWVSTYTAIAAGEVATVTSDVHELIGRPAQSLREYLRSLSA